MLIALTGYMGSGKSTVGALLSDALGCPLIDLDEVIARKAGRSIPEIFEADGERGFRRLEKQALEKTVEKYAESTAILSLGGGTVTVPGAVQLLQEKTVCIYLKADTATLQARLEGQTEGRPLAGENFAGRLSEREPLYQAAAHITLETDGLTPSEVADEIIISCL